MPENITTRKTRSERRRRHRTTRELTARLAGHRVLDLHRPVWSEHPVPYCSTCPGGETWPCPPVQHAADTLTAAER